LAHRRSSRSSGRGSSPRRDLTYERIDVGSGAALTGIIGVFVVIACAATLFATGNHNVNDARDAALALKPLAGRAAATPVLFVTQVVNAVLLLPLLVALRRLGRDESVLGDLRNRGVGDALAIGAFVVVARSILALAIAAFL